MRTSRHAYRTALIETVIPPSSLPAFPSSRHEKTLPWHRAAERVFSSPLSGKSVEHRREGQHRYVADDRQRDSDTKADERELGAIRAVRRVDVAQGCQDGASRAAEQTGEQVARLLGTGQFRLPRHEHLVVLVLHHVTPIRQGDRGHQTSPGPHMQPPSRKETARPS